MTQLQITFATGLLLLTTACAPSGVAETPAPIAEKQAKQLEKELKGKVAGKPVSCIPMSRSDSPIRISDDMLLYRVSGKLVYQNLLRGSCNGLARRDDIMVTETFGGQNCRGDLIRMVDPYSGINGGVCVLGDFIPYRAESSVAEGAK
jgi:hypothetical protein